MDQFQGWVVAFISLAFYLAVGRWRRGRRMRDLALLAFAVGTSCLHHTVRTAPSVVLPHGVLKRNAVILFGAVTSDAENRFGRLRFLVRADSVQAGSLMYGLGGSVQVTVPYFCPVPEVDEEYMFEGQLYMPTPLRNPGGFDARAHCARSGIYYMFRCSGKSAARPLKGRKASLSFNGTASNIRRTVMRTFDSSIGGEEAALLSALLLGERSAVRGPTSKRFADAGVIHILAVSGLHVGILWLALLVILRIMRIPYRFGVLLSCLLLAYYCCLTGLRPPVVRATIMFACFSFTFLLERELDPLNAVCVAALVILIYNPSYIFDPGFQLSFACTASIVRMFRFLRGSLPRRFSASANPFARWLISAFFVSLSAQLGSMPLVMYHFNRAPLVSLAANLVVIPLAGADICLGLLVGVLGFIKGPLLELTACAGWLSLRLTLVSVNLFSSIPFSCLRTVRPPVFLMAVWYLLVFLLPELRSSRRARIIALFVCLAALNGLLWESSLRNPRPPLSVTFLDVGQGDCCLLEASSGRRVLIDAGPSLGEHDCGESVVAPFMWGGRRRTIDTVVLTHPQSDHIGGMAFLLDHFEIGEVVDAGVAVPSKKYLEFLKKVREEGIKYRSVRRGSALDFGDINVAVLHPDEETARMANIDPHFDVNNSSIVLAVDCGRVRLLFTGDVHDEIGRVLDSIERVDILKAPHHGSEVPNKTILDVGLIPTVIVFSVGLRNRFNHPSPEVILGYLRSGARIYRTDRDGAVLFSTDGRSFELTTMRELQSMPPLRRFISNYERNRRERTGVKP